MFFNARKRGANKLGELLGREAPQMVAPRNKSHFDG